jgi:hypothetical protein
MDSRIRRVKCDEGKPSCHRCESTGRRCDGYAAPKYQPPVAIMVVLTGSGRTECDVKSQRALHFFREICAPLLSTYGTSTLWNSLVLQACYIDESIKHLVIATSTLSYNRQFELDHSQESFLFLIHYGKALRLLSQYQRPNTAFILMACLLLAMCDELRQNVIGAHRHIEAGKRILGAYYTQKSRAMIGLEMEEISLAFSQLSSSTSPIISYHTPPGVSSRVL